MARQKKTAKTARTAKAAAPKVPNAAPKPAKNRPLKRAAKTPAKATKTAPAQQDKPTVKPRKATKPIAAVKGSTVSKPKVAKKGRRPRDNHPATPQITSPQESATVNPGVDLTVNGSTNRDDFGYIVSLLDVTPPGPPPPPTLYYIAAPAGSTFSTVIPGTNLAAGKTYQLRLYVDPASGATPPNHDFIITIYT